MNFPEELHIFIDGAVSQYSFDSTNKPLHRVTVFATQKKVIDVSEHGRIE